MSQGSVACIGAGVIGAGWIARLIENGIDVTVFDPSPQAEPTLNAVLRNAEHAYARLTMAQRPVKGQVIWCDTLPQAVTDATWIIESVPERLNIKQAVYAELEKQAPTDAVIASSTSGILPSDLQSELTHPERLLVAHPFNPVYLLPMVEIVAGQQTDPALIDRASGFYQALGMKPVCLRREVDAFVADRLLEALWREALWLIKDGVCTTQELDDIVRFGFGLRYAQMGVFETYRLAGGSQGMRHFLEQFGPCLKLPWTKLMDVPELDEKLIERISSQSDEQSSAYSVHELERIRDDNLVGILQSLKANDWGAGQLLAAYERQLFDAGAGRTIEKVITRQDKTDCSEPLLTTERRVPPDWTDYNNHMNEARYLQCFGDATDRFIRFIGCDADYIASGLSWFTVETHIRHLDEVRVNELIRTYTQCLSGTGKKMHLFHQLMHEDGRVLATGEHMLVHVSLDTRSACEPTAAVRDTLAGIAQLHQHLPTPDGAGRSVGQPRG